MATVFHVSGFYRGAQRMLGPVLEAGIMTSNTSTTITDANKGWATDQWAGHLVVHIRPSGFRVVRRILSNTANVLTLASAGITQSTPGDLYVIMPGEQSPKAQMNVLVRSASGSLGAGETTTPVTGLWWVRLAVIRLNVTTLGLPDADDEVDFYIQTSYNEGTTWADLENIHFSNANNGQTVSKLLVVGGPQSSAVARNETDGTLADNTKNDLPLGDRLRIKTAVTGATAPVYAYSAEAALYA